MIWPLPRPNPPPCPRPRKFPPPRVEGIVVAGIDFVDTGAKDTEFMDIELEPSQLASTIHFLQINVNHFLLQQLKCPSALLIVAY